jgi:hypothetical protein
MPQAHQPQTNPLPARNLAAGTIRLISTGSNAIPLPSYCKSYYTCQPERRAIAEMS